MKTESSMINEDEIDSPLIGKWRIIDMMGPGYIVFDKNGRGEMSFGCVTGEPNHILHLLLSVCTAGFWLLVWLFQRSTTPQCSVCGKE